MIFLVTWNTSGAGPGPKRHGSLAIADARPKCAWDVRAWFRVHGRGRVASAIALAYVLAAVCKQLHARHCWRVF